MYIKVKLLSGFAKRFTYSVPKEWAQKPALGTIISVPIKNSVQLAIVDEIIENHPKVGYEIKPAIKIEAFPKDANYSSFIEKVSNYYCLEPVDLIQRVKFFISKERESSVVEDDVISAPKASFDYSNELTQDQLEPYNYLKSKLSKKEFCPTLIHGVTGSGKSEIYKKLIFDTISQNNSAIMLLPEVTLAMQFELKFKAFFKDAITIYSFHSGSSVKEKRALWQALLDGKPVLIIGVHQPILLPISNLGLIIVDEEHEPGYQEKKHPKLNSKEIALMRAHQCKIPIILGSATPSVTSFYNVWSNSWKCFTLKNRYSGEFPEIKIVNLLNKQKRDFFWISRELKEALYNCLNKKEQAIVFINRRGYSFFVQCSDCGHIFECANCSVSLTLHDDDKLNCHYCGFESSIPVNCPKCPCLAENFLKKGIGTQQVVSILKRILPNAVIERADLDVSKNKNKFKETLKKFENGDIDILVGTQTITKGFHFPNVTMVGILWADINLSFPIYNASEIALQQLIQVAGRAGRQKKSSKVVVQVMSENRINNFFNEIDYTDFAREELDFRKLFNYPPYCRLAQIELRNSDEVQILKDCKLVQEALKKLTKDANVDILGPASPAVYKVNNFYRKSFYLKANSATILSQVYLNLRDNKFNSDIYFVPSPQN